MENEGFIKSPQSLQSTGAVDRLPDGHYRRSVGAIESASFDCANEIAAQARIMFNLMTVSCQTFSLGHILINCVFGAAIRIANGDGDDVNEDGRDGVCRAAKSGSYYAAKTTPPNKTFALRVLQHPLRQAVPV